MLEFLFGWFLGSSASENPEKKKVNADVRTPDVNQVIGFLKEKNIDTSCKECDSNDPYIQVYSMVALGKFINWNRGGFLPTIVVACKNCGHIKQYALGNFTKVWN